MSSLSSLDELLDPVPFYRRLGGRSCIMLLEVSTMLQIVVPVAILCMLLMAGCVTSPSNICPSGPVSQHQIDESKHQINGLLNDWHDAASRADFKRYFGHMTDRAVFIGTDSTEYWTGQEFKDFAKPYFDQGKGWTYVPHDRHIYLSTSGDTAWFDEKLDNAKYGDCRGSGACVLVDGAWKIAHYNLAFAIPNDVAEPVVKIVREYGASHPATTK